MPLEVKILISPARRFKAHPNQGHGWPSHFESTLFWTHPRFPSTPPTIRWALPFYNSFPAFFCRSPTKPQMFHSFHPAHRFLFPFVFHSQTKSRPDPAAFPPSTKSVSPYSHSGTTRSPVHPPIPSETASLLKAAPSHSTIVTFPPALPHHSGLLPPSDHSQTNSDRSHASSLAKTPPRFSFLAPR